MTYRAKDLTVIELVLTDAQAEPFQRLLAELSSEWSEPMRLRAEYEDGAYTFGVKAADEIDDPRAANSHASTEQ